MRRAALDVWVMSSRAGAARRVAGGSTEPLHVIARSSCARRRVRSTSATARAGSCARVGVIALRGVRSRRARRRARGRLCMEAFLDEEAPRCEVALVEEAARGGRKGSE
jgi:hypothetical protein